MILMVLGVPAVVLIFTLDVVALACYLKRTRCPYARDWCARYVRGVGTLRDACFMLFLILTCTAFLLVFPMLLGLSDHHATALCGSVDLLSSFALYGLWKWTGHLIQLAVLHKA